MMAEHPLQMAVAARTEGGCNAWRHPEARKDQFESHRVLLLCLYNITVRFSHSLVAISTKVAHNSVACTSNLSLTK